IIIICDLLGIPFEDREKFQRWAIQLVGAGQDPEVVEAASKSMVEYSDMIIQQKTVNPGDDMISALIQAGDGGGDKHTHEELNAMIFLFMIAGHITSQHTLSNGILSLLTHPDQFEKIKADP